MFIELIKYYNITKLYKKKNFNFEYIKYFNTNIK